MGQYLAEMHRMVGTFNTALLASGSTEQYISKNKLLAALRACEEHARLEGNSEHGAAVAEIIALIQGGGQPCQ